jgi:hypothetical protein
MPRHRQSTRKGPETLLTPYLWRRRRSRAAPEVDDEHHHTRRELGTIIERQPR